MDGRRIIINYKESLPAEDMEDQGMSAVKGSLFLHGRDEKNSCCLEIRW